ncbi:cytochrome P450 [Pseudonocardia pini]|uniref:cytochrome P450 n=1 Tax=Pseudonocardia pini TaxID=2758030 RepID=UPI0015F0F170|nr:cytochrome P450 [Pseudonocardia pini]
MTADQATDQVEAAGCPVAHGRPTVEFDHHFGAEGTQPEEAYRELREKCPVAWTEANGGHWVVTKHADVTQVFMDYGSFSSARTDPTGELSTLAIPPLPMKLNVPEEFDPPQFHPYRRLLNGVLSQKAVRDGLTERIRYWADWHIDQVIESGACDMVYDLASPMVGAVVLEWLGFPQEDWRRISQSFHDAVGYAPSDPRAQKAFGELAGFQEPRISEEIAIRQRELAEGRVRDDVMGFLVSQEIDGAPMTTEMAEGMVRLLIAGGVDTTASGSTSAFVHLYQHPEHRQALIEDPSLWDTAVDEFLRRYPPVLGHARTVVKPVTVGGYEMAPGERVLVSEASACWDADQFDRADEVVLDRTPNRHAAFGLGIHRCAGLHLARLMFRILVERVLERMPDYVVAEDQLHRYAEQSGMAGWTSVPATFTPGPRVLG